LERSPGLPEKYVAVFLRYNDILALCDTSKSVQEEICGDDFFWEMKTRHDFGVEYDYPPWPRENWEEDYRFWMRTLERDLIEAIKSGNVTKVSELIEFGVDINSRSQGLFPARSSDGITPLMGASMLGKIEIVRLLLDNGADITAKTANDRITALGYTVHRGNDDIVRLLLEYGADVTAKDRYGGEAIIVAPDNSDSLELVDMLLEKGADINSARQNGRTLLLSAVRGKSGEYIQGLIDRGAEVDARYRSGVTPLLQAIRSRNREAVRVLLDNGADIYARDSRGLRPVDILSMPGYPDRIIRGMISDAFRESF